MNMNKVLSNFANNYSTANNYVSPMQMNSNPNNVVANNLLSQILVNNNLNAASLSADKTPNNSRYNNQLLSNNTHSKSDNDISALLKNILNNQQYQHAAGSYVYLFICCVHSL